MEDNDAPSVPRPRPPVDAFTVCFTGFDDPEKERLAALATSANMWPVSSVSGRLGLLVAGPEPGPKKVRVARERKVKIVTKDAFLSMLKTGASPDSLPELEPPPDAIELRDSLDVPEGVFVAVDFETADYKFDSACAVGVVRVENGIVVSEKYRLIRPPREKVRNAHVHGLDWKALSVHPPFAKVWWDIALMFHEADYIIAHNVYFDRSVLETCCASFGIMPPGVPFICTLKGAKAVMGKRSCSLDSLCEHLEIPFQHHHALSDAKAAMKLFEKLHQRGLKISDATVAPLAASAKDGKRVMPSAKPQTRHDSIKEFKTIIEALACDEVLTKGEFDYICNWLSEHDDLSGNDDFQPVFEMASEILSDGIVTEEELEQMLELLNILFTD